MINQQPSLTDLQDLINKVPGYPISAKQLVNLATKEKASSSVIGFFKAFPDDEVFSNQDDLMARSEHIEMMHREDQPSEILMAPEED